MKNSMKYTIEPSVDFDTGDITLEDSINGYKHLPRIHHLNTTFPIKHET